MRYLNRLTAFYRPTCYHGGKQEVDVVVKFQMFYFNLYLSPIVQFVCN